MAADAVCHSWRDLLTWKNVKQLHMDFEHSTINMVHIAISDWPQALEFLLPKAKFTSIRVILPQQIDGPKNNDKNASGHSFFWPLSLLQNGIMIIKHRAAFSTVSNAIIQGCASSTAEYEFVCHLLELCPSLTSLQFSLANDAFDMNDLQWALEAKSIKSLGITMSHLSSYCNPERLALLCHVLNPNTLESVMLNIGGEDPEDHPYVFIFDEWCTFLWSIGHHLPALKRITIGTRRFVLSEDYNDDVDAANDPNAPFFPNVLRYVFPHLRTIKFTFPVFEWLKWFSLFGSFSLQGSVQPITVCLTSNHCSISKMRIGFDTQSIIKTNRPFSDCVKATNKGFTSRPKFPCPMGDFEFMCERISPPSCECIVCRSEYHWVKYRLIKLLKLLTQQKVKGIPQLYQDLCIFSCQLNRLKHDVPKIFPNVQFFRVVNEFKICVEDKSLFVKRVVHGERLLAREALGCDVPGNSCPGCILMDDKCWLD